MKNGICEVYCNRECKTCKDKKDFCVECADFYKMEGEGNCVIGSQALSAAVDSKPVLNMLKKRGMKMIFVAFDDLWLYQYHKQEYDGL